MRSIVLVFIISLTAVNLEAQSFNETLKLVASDRGNADFFGQSVSIDGDYAVVGAYTGGTLSNPVSRQGTAYIFKKNNNGNWQEVKKIVASDGTYQDYFGHSVDISGDYVIVGAYQDDEDASGANMLSAAGAAYIFKKDEGGTNNWGEVKKLVASDRGENDNFGRSVGISGDFAVVGANYEKGETSTSNGFHNKGAAYIFEKDTGGADNWGEVKKLTASDGSGGDDFGRNLLIDGDFIIVGAKGHDYDASGSNPLNSAGAVYVFEKNVGGTNNWGEAQKIVATDRAAQDGFGYSVAKDGDYLAVGAFYASTSTVSYSGAAYVFKKDIIAGTNSWSEFKRLEASDAGTDDLFGYAIDISGDNVIVGAYSEDEDLTGNNTISKAGAAYIFNKNEGGLENWGETQKLISNERSMNDYFGFSVAIEGDLVMVGTRGEELDTAGGNSLSGAGAVYVFEFGIASSTDVVSEFPNLKIYPNPAHDKLFVESQTTFQQAIIYNIIGQPIKEVSIQNNQAEINVSDLSKGIYMLQLMMENGESVTKQIIKN
ncbi:MAG: T9SS type A sorting domain-containing protein [Saprospiraceae bacterium]